MFGIVPPCTKDFVTQLGCSIPIHRLLSRPNGMAFCHSIPLAHLRCLGMSESPLPDLVLQLSLSPSPRAGLRLGVSLKLLSLRSLFAFSIISLSTPALSLHPHCNDSRLSQSLPWTNASAFPAGLPCSPFLSSTSS